MDVNLEKIKAEMTAALDAFFEEVWLEAGELIVVGGSSSEVKGGHIGKASSAEIGEVLIDCIIEYTRARDLVLAVQCCEHLNRALVVPRSYARTARLEEVNAIPQGHAGGSLATAYWQRLDKPCLVEHVQAAAGLDIGDSFIGMHLRPVAVPLRLGITSIGQAHLTAAKTRLKRIGGERAIYQED